MMDERFFEKYIGRFVTLLSPVFVALATMIANFAQDAIGANLDAEALATYLSTVAIGASALIYKWISNRGDWEVTQENLKLAAQRTPDFPELPEHMKGMTPKQIDDEAEFLGVSREELQGDEEPEDPDSDQK